MLSILIVNWNTKDDLRRCLLSLKSHPPDGTWQAIVVDNDSQDGSAEMVAGECPWANLLAEKSNLGYAKATNLALKRAEGDILLLNPDTKVMEGSLNLALRHLRSQERTGAVAAQLVDMADGSTQQSIRNFPTPGAIFLDFFGLGSYRNKSFDYSKPAEVEQPMATFLLIREEVLREIGGMDERFPIFFNDVDLLFRMHNAGWSVRYEPDVKVRHAGGASTKQVRKSMIWESHRSLIRYWHKWYWRPWNALLLTILFAGVWAAAFVRAKGWDGGFRP